MEELVPDLGLEATAPVEATIGPRTSAWLQSMGWTPPSPPAPAASDIVTETVHQPAPTLEQAVAENEERARRLLEAQTWYQGLKAGTAAPEDLDRLLEYFGVQLRVFMPPPPVVEPNASLES